MINSVSINESFLVEHCSDDLEVDDQTLLLIDEIWAGATQANTQLFDGNVLAVMDATPDRLLTTLVPYRYFYAASTCTEVSSSLKLNIAAVSGALFGGNLLMAGQRAQFVTQHQGLWELVPSGSLTAQPGDKSIDYRQHLLEELQEEVGISKSRVLSMQPFLLVFDELAHVYDVCCTISTLRAELERAVNEFKPNEYSSLELHKIRDVQESMKSNHCSWIPTSVEIVNALAYQSRIP